MRITQITDSHISVNNPQRTIDLKACVDAVNALDPQPDLVVHTGDIAHDGLADEYETARSVLDTLSAPYLVIAGNRDRRSELMRVFSDRTAVHDGGEFIQYSVEFESVRLIMIDTVSDGSKGALGVKRLQHIDSMLNTASEKPVIVFMHHSPFEATEIPDPFQFEDWTDVETLLDMLTQHSGVQAIYCGHIHRNVQAMAGKLPVSALSCMACDLRKGKLSTEDATRPMYKVIDLG